MPKAAVHATDLDYDLAMLGDPIGDDSLDFLDALLPAKDAAGLLVELIGGAQSMIESGVSPFEVRERLSVAIQDAVQAASEGVLRMFG